MSPYVEDENGDLWLCKQCYVDDGTTAPQSIQHYTGDSYDDNAMAIRGVQKNLYMQFSLFMIYLY